MLLTISMRKAPLLACLPIFLLAACGRAEPVSEMPTQEELAEAANAAAANALLASSKDDAVDNLNYVNAERGFSVSFPEGWVKDDANTNADGAVYQDPGAGADVRVTWQKNEAKHTLAQFVQSITSGSEGVSSDSSNENEYRGTSNDGQGRAIAMRILRQSDGSIVSATFAYPEMLGEQYQPVANKTLNSLRIFAPKAASAEGADNAVAAAPRP